MDHLPLMRDMRNTQKILAGNPEGRVHSEELGVDGRIILNQVLMKQCWRMWIGFGLVCSEYGPVVGSCEHGNETFGFKERRGPLD